MATQIDDGPATGTAVLTFNTNAPGLEFHAQVGANSLAPSQAPYIDPQGGQASFTPINLIGVWGIVVNPC